MYDYFKNMSILNFNCPCDTHCMLRILSRYRIASRLYSEGPNPVSRLEQSSQEMHRNVKRCNYSITGYHVWYSYVQQSMLFAICMQERGQIVRFCYCLPLQFIKEQNTEQVKEFYFLTTSIFVHEYCQGPHQAIYFCFNTLILASRKYL